VPRAAAWNSMLVMESGQKGCYSCFVPKGYVYQLLHVDSGEERLNIKFHNDENLAIEYIGAGLRPRSDSHNGESRGTQCVTFSRSKAPGQFLRAGRTKRAAGGLRQRVIQFMTTRSSLNRLVNQRTTVTQGGTQPRVGLNSRSGYRLGIVARL
jgi:hypothetical protein